MRTVRGVSRARGNNFASEKGKLISEGGRAWKKRKGAVPKQLDLGKGEGLHFSHKNTS